MSQRLPLRLRLPRSFRWMPKPCGQCHHPIEERGIRLAYILEEWREVCPKCLDALEQLEALSRLTTPEKGGL